MALADVSLPCATIWGPWCRESHVCSSLVVVMSPMDRLSPRIPLGYQICSLLLEPFQMLVHHL